MILLIDNYDSFTYNLAQIAGATNPHIKIVRNDRRALEKIRIPSFSHVIISSGIQRDQDSVIYDKLFHSLKGNNPNKKEVPILGIGFGYRIICKFYGAMTEGLKEPSHGKQRHIHIANGCKIFKGLPPVIEGAMYHSFRVKKASLPDELLIIAEDIDGELMGIRHRDHHIYGLEFHPESILTPQGRTIIDNFLKIGVENL